MSEWICEDVGLVINELREKFSERLNQLAEQEGEKMNPDIENQIRGLNLAYDILDEVADNWTSDDLPQYIIDAKKQKYGEIV